MKKGVTLVVGALIATTGGCSKPDESLRLAGYVDDDTVTVSAPNFVAPTLNLDAGFPSAPGATANASAPSNRAATVSLAGLVVAVPVQAGTVVRAGDVVARFDDAALRAGLVAAGADAALARAQIRVVDAAIRKTTNSTRELVDKRDTVRGTMSRVNATRRQLVAKRAQARALLKRIPAKPIPRPPGPGMPNLPTPAAVRAIIAKLTAAIATIDAGLSAARAGLARIATGLATLADVRQQLRGTRRIVVAAAQGSAVAVELARYTVDTADVRSPVAGTVTSVVDVGAVLPAGAPIATIAPATAPRIVSWVPPEQHICPGDPAEVTADWNLPNGRLEARVATIGTGAEFPPTSQPTDEIHLTRAIPIVLSISAIASDISRGVPVDVSVTTCAGPKPRPSLSQPQQ